MSICSQARSRREAAINKRLGPKTGRASRSNRKTTVSLVMSGKVSKTARKSGAK